MTASLLTALALLACAAKTPPETAVPKAETEVELTTQELDVDPEAMPIPHEVLDEDAEKPAPEEGDEPESEPLPDPDEGPSLPTPRPQH